MKHLPFNHTWQTLEFRYHREPTDRWITTFNTITMLRQFCSCGRTRTIKIANFPMTEEQVEEYVKEVFD